MEEKLKRSLLPVLALLAALSGTSGMLNAAEQPPLMKENPLRHDNGKPLYFVHLNDPPLALHAAARKAGPAKGRLDVNAVENRNYRAQLRQKQDTLAAAISGTTGGAGKITRRFQLALNALVVALNESDLERVRTLPGVARIERVEMREMHTDRGPGHVRATELWAGLPGIAGTMGEGVVVGIIDSGIRSDHPSFADIGGDGYDHTNPLGAGVYFGDCVTDPELCNDKLIGVVSYPEITDTFPEELPRNGWDYNGHGSHVASTAAGNVLYDVPAYNVIGGEGEYRFPQLSGVAPHANIISYQVCFPDGGCMSQLAVQAVEHAIENGVDVLNYSIGGVARSPWESADAMAFLSARAAGIHVATSAGNSGPGPSTIGMPGGAPWLTSVAAYTHDRDVPDATLAEFSGGLNPPAAPLAGKGVTRGYYGPVVKAESFGDAQCLAPFPAGTFRGEIVVCERGQIARVEKGRNVLAGGAGGMVLINVADGLQDVVMEPHELPAIHLDTESGQALLAWLSEGERHIARITAAEPYGNDAVANYAGTFTSRGPVAPYGSIPAPHIAAPGVDIYAAWVEDAPFRDQIGVAPFYFLNGTSMSSPHVAGALALLKAAFPDWTPAEAQSALMLTADPATRRDYDDNPSTLFDAGSGMLDVAAAVNTGIVFDESEQNYLDANPAANGDPAQLNLPALVHDACLATCSWTRTVRATRDASWQVVMRPNANMNITVEPASFALQAGQEQQLTITATIGDTPVTDWVHDRILLASADRTISPAGIPVAVFFKAGVAPEYHALSTRRDMDSGTIPGFRSIASDTLHADVRGLVGAMKYEAFLKGDDTPHEPFIDIEGVVHTVTVNLNTKHRVLIAEILEADSPDLDLFIARDSDLDGKPTGAEWGWGQLCVSGGSDSNERCIVDTFEPGTYWIAVHNFEASAPDALDRHVLSVAVLEDDQAGLTVTPPAAVENNEPFVVQAGWDHAMTPGASYYAAIDLGTTPDIAGNIGRTILRIDRLEDDFNVTVDSTSLVAGESAVYTWSVATVPTDGTARDYIVTATVPDGFVFNADANSTINGNEVRWEFSQSPGAPERTGTLTLETPLAEQARDLTLDFTHVATPGGSASKSAPAISIAASPVARINGLSSVEASLQEGESLDLDVAASTGSFEGETLQFEWQQLSGPAAVPQPAGDMRYTLAAPSVSADTTLRYRLIASNDRVTGIPAELVVTVRNKPEKGGGGSGSPWLPALLGLLAWQRRRR